ncbi:MAG: 16S rRNA (cytosine(1402)-N(4))-methyltransferase, partial [Alphaproteobacteria bacterium]|nr:16S rRNA (cytosine(1402)-N(4))-methyltransferase [Alphaproteobacteria bacterium]
MGARGNAHGQARGEAPISQPHVPVLLAEVLDAMSPRDNAVYVDGTFGAGGYSRALLEAAQCRVIAFDRDPTAQAAANTLTAEFGDRFSFIAGCFGDMRALLAAANVAQVDGVVFDLGVSSMQL